MAVSLQQPVDLCMGRHHHYPGHHQLRHCSLRASCGDRVLAFFRVQGGKYCHGHSLYLWYHCKIQHIVGGELRGNLRSICNLAQVLERPVHYRLSFCLACRYDSFFGGSRDLRPLKGRFFDKTGANAEADEVSEDITRAAKPQDINQDHAAHRQVAHLLPLLRLLVACLAKLWRALGWPSLRSLNEMEW